ncbi:formin-like protein 5 [Triticum dicoccoides]|uniref:formin-like protein 5 n=1 Tax=Triticum dicoccoides TaxID=85692 RepID=UPI00189165AF|nr:formin-like protein 5 [Triticum dicoccoides]
MCAAPPPPLPGAAAPASVRRPIGPPPPPRHGPAPSAAPQTRLLLAYSSRTARLNHPARETKPQQKAPPPPHTDPRSIPHLPSTFYRATAAPPPSHFCCAAAVSPVPVHLPPRCLRLAPVQLLSRGRRLALPPSTFCCAATAQNTGHPAPRTANTFLPHLPRRRPGLSSHLPCISGAFAAGGFHPLARIRHPSTIRIEPPPRVNPILLPWVNPIEVTSKALPWPLAVLPQLPGVRSARHRPGSPATLPSPPRPGSTATALPFACLASLWLSTINGWATKKLQARRLQSDGRQWSYVGRAQPCSTPEQDREVRWCCRDIGADERITLKLSGL